MTYVIFFFLKTDEKELRTIWNIYIEKYGEKLNKLISNNIASL